MKNPFLKKILNMAAQWQRHLRIPKLLGYAPIDDDYRDR